MKQRFSALDICATVTALRERIVGLRLQSIYDVNNKTFLLKFTKPEHKELVLVESGFRLHTTDYTRDKSITPSSFVVKLRKHLKTRRLTALRQLGMDRVIDFEFAVAAGPQANGTYHVICEFYASGNIILTDYQYNILALLRVVHLDPETSFAVGRKYDMAESREIEPVTRKELVEWLRTRAGPKDNLKRTLATLGAYGPALSEHVIVRAGLNPTLRVATGIDLDEQSPQITALAEAYQEAYEVVTKLASQVSPGYIAYMDEAKAIFDEFHPWLFAQHQDKPHREFESFLDAADVFFSNIEAQKLQVKAHQQEQAAVKKLDAIKAEHQGRVDSLEMAHRKTEEQARRIEVNLEFVDQAVMIIRQAVAAGLDWQELDDLVKDQKQQGNPVAERIVKLNLGRNQITLLLDDPADSSDSDDDEEENAFSGPLEVDVDIFESAFTNAQRYYNSRRQAGIKHAKTLAVSSQALQSAEQKIKTDLKATKITATVSQTRKVMWFEKFSWFLSSDGYLVLAGRDMQQNELLVKRHLRAGDAYVHADIHGAASVIIKNKQTAAPESTSLVDKTKGEAAVSAETIPPSTLFQAGIMSVCQSRAWDAKIVTSAWWVEAHQVSKTAPSGEYLSTGSFMIRGKKRFLPPTQLVYGFGFLFRLADDESVARHVAAQQQRVAIMEENRQAVEEVKVAEEHADDGEDTFDIVGGKEMDFVAARKKYNLEEVEDSVVDDFKDQDPNAQQAEPRAMVFRDGRRHGTRQQALEQQKKLSKKERRRLEEEDKFEKKQQQQQQQKRGRKGKMKKMKEKYAEQDDRDRELRMALLGAKGDKVDVHDVLDNEQADDVSGAEEELLEKLEKLETTDQETPQPTVPAANAEVKQEVEAEDDPVNDLSIDQLSVLDTLTPSPLPGDNLGSAIPVCAPYPALSQYKYRVKLIPGTMKKGVACKMATTVAATAAENNKPKSTHSNDPWEADRLELEQILATREKELMRAVPDTEMIMQMLGKVKVMAPNLESIRQKSKAKAKAKAKAKGK